MTNTSKLLFLVRHAKSSWKDSTVADTDRTLNKRGRRDAPEMGRRIAAMAEPPQQIISSPAVRALTTAEIIATELGQSADSVTVIPELYGGGVASLMAVIRGLPNDPPRVLLVGHNPSLTDLVNWLTAASIDNVPTAGVAVLRPATDRWEEIDQGQAQLMTYDFPKNSPRR